MFTLIGADGKEYGPATTEQVREWLDNGRATLDTLARRDGTTEWRRLREIAEFAPPPAPPPPIASAPGPDHSWAVLTHLSALCGYIIPLGHVLGPLLVWQLKKDTAPEVILHGKEAVNFQLSCLLYAVIAALLIFAMVGVPLLFALGLMNVICITIASIKANQGIAWHYPLTIRFVS